MECKNCLYYNKELNICKIEKFYVNKNNIKEIVCKYNKNAISLNEAYKNVNK
jgi:hypothetical protein